jgi:RNA polymerase sigma-70 factor (ECF subfamily)
VGRAYFRGQTAREIAEADGIPLGTVKTRLRSAMIKVRKANEGKDLL